MSRSINYITHRLPQQCLKSSWISPDGTPVPSNDNQASTTNSPTSTITSGTPAQVVPEQNQQTEARPLSSNTSEILETSTVAQTTSQSSQRHEAGSSISTSTTTGASASTTSAADTESESDSPLDNAHFLSFDEWKKQNLERAGQSGENIGDRRPQTGGESRRRPPNINNALDSLGEDTEIELDFGGFVNPKPNPTAQDDRASATADQATDRATDGGSRGVQGRNKDAGKTCKERFNYASFDCAANVLKTNSQCKGSSSILVENKDSYMLNECSATNKFIIVELCNDILVDTVVLANFEFFSSMFRTFRVSVSDRYPVKMDRWKELGIFEARNSREVQAFLVPDSLMWARYLRVEFLTQYGNEYYCPVSLLRVHGTTMMEEFKNQNEGSRGFEDIDEGSAEVMKPVTTTQVEPAAAEKSEGKGSPTEQSHSRTESQAEKPSSDAQDKQAAPESSKSAKQGAPKDESDGKQSQQKVNAPVTPNDARQGLANDEHVLSLNRSLSVCPRIDIKHYQTPSGQSRTTTAGVRSEEAGQNATKTNSEASSVGSTPPNDSSAKPDQPLTNNPNEQQTRSSHSQAIQTSSNTTSQDQTRYPTTSVQPPPAMPTTQENFFKSLHKRLQLLEANATLSLQYIEEQSRILRDAFAKVEKRQLSKTTTFLESLNATVLTELQGFRQQYDQIWQSTVLELEAQREQSQQQIVAVSARLSILADEVIFQKRMSIIQSLLLLVCLGLVIFSRSSSYLELPSMQNVLSRSPSTLRLPFESPLASPGSTRPSSARQNSKPFSGHESPPSHTRHLSDDSAGPHSPILEFSPPTPTSNSPSDRSVSPSPRSAGDDSPEKRPISRRTPKRPVPVGESLSSPSVTTSNSTSWPEDEHASNLLTPDRQTHRNVNGTSSPRQRLSTDRRRRDGVRSLPEATDSEGDEPSDGSSKRSPPDGLNND
ncbi:MAG: hypothetical protein M4579_001804 [Chaenotheca gracillima]|nr:MAG: hypothetical protein M4579_001804 [Chaenotheca gracillima]